MADRIEREIEEILAKLDQEQPPQRDRAPISILAHRDKAKPRPPRPARAPRANPLDRISPATLLLTGAAMVVGGLLFSNVFEPLIWASLAGVIVFLGAFAWSFVRTPRPGGSSQPGGHYWRDRYIEYTPRRQSAWSRVTRRFRR